MLFHFSLSSFRFYLPRFSFFVFLFQTDMFTCFVFVLEHGGGTHPPSYRIVSYRVQPSSLSTAENYPLQRAIHCKELSHAKNPRTAKSHCKEQSTAKSNCKEQSAAKIHCKEQLQRATAKH
jgi:hypothetical protein